MADFKNVPTGSGDGPGLSAMMDWFGELEVGGRLLIAAIGIALIVLLLRRTIGQNTVDLESHEYSSFKDRSDD